MAAIIQLIMTLLPLILRLFGFTAAGYLSWKGLDNYAVLQAAATANGVAASPGDLNLYVYGHQAGGIAALTGFWSWASWIARSRARKEAAANAVTASLTDWFAFIGKVVSLLSENPQLFTLIEELIGLLSKAGLTPISQHLSAAVKAARAGK